MRVLLQFFVVETAKLNQEKIQQVMGIFAGLVFYVNQKVLTIKVLVP